MKKTRIRVILNFLIADDNPAEGNTKRKGGRAFGKRYQETQEKNEKAQTQETFIPQQAQEEVILDLRDRSCRVRRY